MNTLFSPYQISEFGLEAMEEGWGFAMVVGRDQGWGEVSRNSMHKVIHAELLVPLLFQLQLGNSNREEMHVK